MIPRLGVNVLYTDKSGVECAAVISSVVNADSGTVDLHVFVGNGSLMNDWPIACLRTVQRNYEPTPNTWRPIR